MCNNFVSCSHCAITKCVARLISWPVRPASGPHGALDSGTLLRKGVQTSWLVLPGWSPWLLQRDLNKIGCSADDGWEIIKIILIWNFNQCLTLIWGPLAQNQLTIMLPQAFYAIASPWKVGHRMYLKKLTRIKQRAEACAWGIMGLVLWTTSVASMQFIN